MSAPSHCKQLNSYSTHTHTSIALEGTSLEFNLSVSVSKLLLRKEAIRLYSKSLLTLTQAHSHLSVIPVRCTEEGLKCEYEWSLSDMLYSLREHSSSIRIFFNLYSPRSLKCHLPELHSPLLSSSVKCSLLQLRELHSALLLTTTTEERRLFQDTT